MRVAIQISIVGVAGGFCALFFFTSHQISRADSYFFASPHSATPIFVIFEKKNRTLPGGVRYQAMMNKKSRHPAFFGLVDVANREK